MKKRGKFHPLRIEGVPEAQQGLIFYLCLCYKHLPEHKRHILDEYYERIGKQHAAALRAMMQTDESFVKICMDNYIASQTTLNRLRNKFYKGFPLDEILR